MVHTIENDEFLAEIYLGLNAVLLSDFLRKLDDFFNLKAWSVLK